MLHLPNCASSSNIMETFTIMNLDLRISIEGTRKDKEGHGRTRKDKGRAWTGHPNAQQKAWGLEPLWKSEWLGCRSLSVRDKAWSEPDPDISWYIPDYSWRYLLVSCSPVLHPSLVLRYTVFWYTDTRPRPAHYTTMLPCCSVAPLEVLKRGERCQRCPCRSRESNPHWNNGTVEESKNSRRCWGLIKESDFET